MLDDLASGDVATPVQYQKHMTHHLLPGMDRSALGALTHAFLLRDPRGTLGLLCAEVGIGFDDAMLSWPAGPRDTDGVWAPHWYAGVEASTGFAPYSPGSGDPLPDRLAPLLERCRPYYDALAPYRLRPSTEETR